MAGETGKNSIEQLSGLSTRDIISALKGRKDLREHVDTISQILELTKEPITEPIMPEIQSPQIEPGLNKEHEPFPVRCRPFCQTKIFAKGDSTDFIQVNRPYQIGERDEFWQRRNNEFMRNANQNPPVPCHEVNFYNAMVASRIHSSEALVALINNQGYRVNRPFDQIIGKAFSLNDINKALETGKPWFASFIEQEFPIFALGSENSNTLSHYFDKQSTLDVNVVNITSSASREMDNQVAQYLAKLYKR